MPVIAVVLFGLFLACLNQTSKFSETVLSDNFQSYKAGSISPPVGPHTEYHFLKEAQLKGNWKITSFYHNPRGSDTAWRVQDWEGAKAMFQSISSKHIFTHPMIVAGDQNWQDYSLEVELTPISRQARVGIIFHYHNDRQYYFYGFDKDNLVILAVNHETAFHTPNETTLASQPSKRQVKKKYTLRAEILGKQFKTFLDEKPVYTVTDSLFNQGKVALVSDSLAYFHSVTVKTSPEEINRIRKLEQQETAIEKQLQEKNPKPLLWKKISTKGFGVGRNLRFGDLNNDGKTDILIGQVVHHAYPRDSFSELGCLTAMTIDGEMLWQIGKPSTDHESLTNDVAFQIYDLDNDGKNEVVYSMNCELIVADASTGKTKFKRKTPELKAVQIEGDDKTKVVKNWSNILGDCLFFCDLRGKGRPSDIVIKDRYTTFWVLDEKLNTQWSGTCRTGHYPFSKDTDGDGKEELFIGYSAYNWKGVQLWSLDKKLQDHCDGIAAVNFREKEGSVPRIFIAGSDQGAIITDPRGTIQKNYFIGHVQNPAIANFRSDLPGLETVTINFWGNQGIIHFFDSSHTIYHDFEPTQYGSMCLPINWNGSEEEFFVLNANILEGGMYDGWGRKAVQFPNDGHPDMCNAVLDLTGDVRDELVVWDPNEIWIYTQSDSPKSAKLYQTKRNPLYNYSNYQLTVSEPIE